MKRFSNFSNKKNLGDADLVSSIMGSEYEFLETNDHLDSNSILKLIDKNENDSILFEIGVGLGEYHFVDKQNNFYTFKGSTLQIEKLFNLIPVKSIVEEVEEEPQIIEKIERGDRGERGIRGIPGERGLIGSLGTQGERGQRGEQGLLGEQGIHGDQGEQGEQGLLGEQGIQGEQGEQGLLGEQGIQGEQGTQGIQGEQGLLGEQGTQGIQGEQGLLGEQGTQGIQGEQGLLGEQGTQGIQGQIGQIGEKGNDGKIGKPGPKGNRGEQGVAGSVGSKGEKGNKGNRGEKGEVGPKGDPATISKVWEEIKIGRGLKYNKKKKELWLDPKTFPPVPVGQIGGALIGGGGSNTGVQADGTLIRDTARFINFGEDFLVSQTGRENVKVSLSSGDANSIQASGGNNEMTQDLDMKTNDILNATIDGGSFS